MVFSHGTFKRKIVRAFFDDRIVRKRWRECYRLCGVVVSLIIGMMAEQSKQVFALSASAENKSVELGVFLEAHPGVDVNLHKDEDDKQALHWAAYRGHATSVRLLVDAKADLEARNLEEYTSLSIAADVGNLDCLQVLIESKADVQTAGFTDRTPAHASALTGHHECLDLLIDANANVNVQDMNECTPALFACLEDRVACLQLLVDANADLNITASHVLRCLSAAMLTPENATALRLPGMPFAVLSCDTDSKTVLLTREITQAIVNAHINEYKQVQSFIDECHSIIKHALNEDVEVDKRVGRRGNGIYHEPLEQVLLYLGLSMKKNQTVNTSIDGKSCKRALMPRHPLIANLWFDLYQRTHCASCSARPAKLKKCSCFTSRYCNTDCQRQHWPTHKPSHKAAMLSMEKNK
jgi:ankyrin repeat protein